VTKRIQAQIQLGLNSTIIQVMVVNMAGLRTVSTTELSKDSIWGNKQVLPLNKGYFK